MKRFYYLKISKLRTEHQSASYPPFTVVPVRQFLSGIFCRVSAVVFFLCAVQAPAAQDALAEGKKLLLHNRPEKALPFFYKAAAEGQKDPKINLYLGVCYIQLGKYAEAEQQFLDGKKSDPAHLHLYAYNLGNIYFIQDRLHDAEEAYNTALTARKLYAPAVLNRANTYTKLENYAQALQDYTLYLNLEPGTSQKQAIQRMVSLLEAEQREAERSRMQEEAQKIAEEAERRAAEERYRKLQEEIDANLQKVGNASSLSAGSDETIDYSEDYSLE
ncbi:MAG: tetratricopeptide repeat protein [Treponema sp.]